MQNLLSKDERAEDVDAAEEAPRSTKRGTPSVTPLKLDRPNYSPPSEGESSPSSPEAVPERKPRIRFKSAVHKLSLGLRLARSLKPLSSSFLPRPDEELGPDFRFLDRRAAFGQSRGRWALHNIISHKRHQEDAEEPDMLQAISDLLIEDVYHTFLDTKFSVQLMFFVVAYFVCFFFFALLYMAISRPCGLGIDGSLIAAYLLSVETMMTIGYGVPDPFMQRCWQGPVVLTAQCLLNLLISSCLIGVIFQGIARPQSRACTILFSEKAVIRCINGVYYFMFRVCDLRSQHALVEPHIRLYCLQHNENRGFEATLMRLDQPDDELGGTLLLSIPSLVIHRIDAWSPLAPTAGESCIHQPKTKIERACSLDSPMMRPHKDRRAHKIGTDGFRFPSWPKPRQRQANADSGNRDCCMCPTCGETFQTPESLRLHCKYSAAVDRASGVAVEAAHYELKEKELASLVNQDPTREDLISYLSRNFKEVVVLVEGIEPTTSATLQARHSYVVGPPECGDAAWDMDFVDCLMMPEDRSVGLGVDLCRFHSLEKVSEETLV